MATDIKKENTYKEDINNIKLDKLENINVYDNINIKKPKLSKKDNVNTDIIKQNVIDDLGNVY
jgi:hypothetical protein